MTGAACVLQDKICSDCGECQFCDLDQVKICDNCMNCVLDGSDYRFLPIDEIITGKQEQRE